MVVKNVVHNILSFFRQTWLRHVRAKAQLEPDNYLKEPSWPNLIFPLSKLCVLNKGQETAVSVNFSLQSNPNNLLSLSSPGLATITNLNIARSEDAEAVVASRCVAQPFSFSEGLPRSSQQVCLCHCQDGQTPSTTPMPTMRHSGVAEGCESGPRKTSNFP